MSHTGWGRRNLSQKTYSWQHLLSLRVLSVPCKWQQNALRSRVLGEVRHSRNELTFDGLDAENEIYPVLSGVKFIQAVHWAWDSQSGASWEGNIDQYLQQEGTCMKAGWEKLHCDNGSEGVRWSLKGCLSCSSALMCQKCVANTIDHVV